MFHGSQWEFYLTKMDDLQMLIDGPGLCSLLFDRE